MEEDNTPMLVVEDGLDEDFDEEFDEVAAASLPPADDVLLSVDTAEDEAAYLDVDEGAPAPAAPKVAPITDAMLPVDEPQDTRASRALTFLFGGLAGAALNRWWMNRSRRF